jgi:basic membrane lipoprotein Med (substrate-binding protein (PBP1-ABC) superfamily)
MRKASRIRPAEKEALKLYLPRLQIPNDEIISSETFKNKHSPLFLEIGFGKGEFLYEMASQYPEINFVGIEIFITGIAKLIRKMCNYDNSNPPQPENIKILIKDASLALKENFLDNSVQKVFILFPDPWPKRKHHKQSARYEEDPPNPLIPQKNLETIQRWNWQQIKSAQKHIHVEDRKEHGIPQKCRHQRQTSNKKINKRTCQRDYSIFLPAQMLKNIDRTRCRKYEMPSRHNCQKQGKNQTLRPKNEPRIRTIVHCHKLMG